MNPPSPSPVVFARCGQIPVSPPRIVVKVRTIAPSSLEQSPIGLRIFSVPIFGGLQMSVIPQRTHLVVKKEGRGTSTLPILAMVVREGTRGGFNT